ncbi:MAG: glycoside hydrolase [Bacteroidales bacterium]|nr:glycoside hydrolase [Bacteroidales bacterium]
MKKTLFATLALLLTLAASGQELKKSVTWNKFREHPAPLPVLGTLVTTPSSLDRPSFWSVGCETMDRDYALFEKFHQYVGETGVGYARLQSGWAKCEPKKKGKYEFAWLDAHVDGLIAEGIHPWMCLCYGNPLYTDGGHDLNARLFGDGPIMDGWLKYVKEVVKRYKGKVTMYEVWNEPDGARDAAGKWVAAKNWADYALLFARTAQAIHETDPDAKICAFGAFSIRTDYFKEGMKRIAELGAGDLVDYVTYHAYWPHPERLIPIVKQLQDDIHAVNPNTVLLQGESGCPSRLDYGHAMCFREWTEYSQAKWDLRHTLMNFSLGIPSSIFTMVDLHYKDYMIQSFGLICTNLKSEPQYKRPKFYAVQHLTSTITADCKATNEDYKLTGASTYEDITVVGVRKNDKPYGFLIWLSGEEPNSSLDRKLVDLTFKGHVLQDPVYVDLVTGYVHELKGVEKRFDGMRLAHFPIWDAPILVVERSQVNFK